MREQHSGVSGAGSAQGTSHSVLSVPQGMVERWETAHDHVLVFICQTSSESSMSLPTVAKAPFLFPLFSPQPDKVLFFGLINMP